MAEQLVEEWLNRQGFFTIRRIREGVGEIDLLGIRSVKNQVEGWHVESQVSFRPVNSTETVSSAPLRLRGS
jgi:Holliday junction resolvase-like predicted endonuclease